MVRMCRAEEIGLFILAREEGMGIRDSAELAGVAFIFSASMSSRHLSHPRSIWSFARSINALVGPTPGGKLPQTGDELPIAGIRTLAVADCAASVIGIPRSIGSRCREEEVDDIIADLDQAIFKA